VDHAALLSLSRDDLIALIVAQQAHIQAQAGQIAVLSSRIAELEAKLAVPAKTPDNSSLPPSKGQKPNLPDRGKKKPRPSRPGVARHLAEDPDHTIEALVAACPHCDHALGPADLPDFHAYDHVDMPTIQPIITRIHRHRGVCPCCRRSVIASAPDGMEPGSPFGPGIAALVLHLHVTQAISFERLSRLMDEVFGLTISEGAITNILSRAEKPLLVACVPIAAAVRASLVVGSDETSARVGGKTWWQWVLLSSTAICHVIVETRAASVVTAFLDGAKPEIWVADRYGGQLGHGAARQMCLAHLLRDTKYAIEAGDAVFAPGFHLLLLRAVAIGKRRERLADTTLVQYHADLERRLDRLLSGPMPAVAAARKLFRAMRRDRDDLFRFVTRRDVPYTNNACERALRPSVIFRKVTNCFRAQWGAKVYAAAASVIATGRLYGRSALNALQAALTGAPVMQSG
jgi:transposase